MLKPAFLLGSLMLATLVAPFAQGATVLYFFNFSGNGFATSGTITVDTTTDPNHVTDITGTFSFTGGAGYSGSITGLEPASYDPNNPTSLGIFDWDNLFYPNGNPAVCDSVAGSGSLDWCGLVFDLSGGYVGALASNGPDYVAAVADNLFTPNVFALDFVTGGFAIPEPAGWVLATSGVFALIVRRMGKRPRTSRQ